MPWTITDGTNSEAITVKNTPSLDHAIAVEAYDSSAEVKVRGDRLPEARPLVVEIGIHETDFDRALAKFVRVLAIARAGGTLRYTEGSEAISRTFSGLKSYEATRLMPAQGLIELRLELLPTGPYWSSTSMGSRVAWVW